ncbi:MULTISPECIES: peptidase inhibitor family I36 protein [Rhodococcus]|uniref:Peptidase inhibitor family I36 n=2 Tax=Rhodococcus ruber TaxID=1830 RepID=A0A098BPX7_9NOCA|nr:hypothetical protein E2561_24320 [Rhodococcus ruber]CDZ90285.1 conserved exported hypothetical protein [Rhodococcus ruber]
MMPTRIRRLLGALVLTAAATSGFALSLGAAPADAAPYCSAGQVCVWSGTNYQGQSASFSRSPSNHCAATLALTVRSVVNNSGYVDFWSGTGCTGTRRTVYGGGATPNLGFDARSASWCDACRQPGA